MSAAPRRDGEILAREFAAMDAALTRLEEDARAFLRDAPRAAAGPGPRETELAEARAAVSNLMVRLARERRNARASMLLIKRRLNRFRRSAPAGRAAEAERELAESRATIAGLLVEVSRRERRAKAERILRGRAARGGKAPARTTDGGAGAAVRAAGDILDERLRALTAGPLGESSEADDCRRLVRVLRLSSRLAGPPAPAAKIVDLRAAVERRLDTWENEFQQRRATLLRDLPARPVRAVFAPGDLEVVLDAMLGHALGRLTRAGAVLVRLTAPTEGAPRLDVQDNGPGEPFLPETAAALAAGNGLKAADAALARDLAEARGAALFCSEVPSGRGMRVSLQFSGAAPRK